MFKLNWKGELQWTHHLSGASHKVIQGLSRGDNLEIYALVLFRGKLNLQEEELETRDAIYKTLLAKFDANGKPLWIKQAKNTGNMITI
jgi:hypothetical protein